MSMDPNVVEYKILGEDLQALVITLDPGEAVVAEAGVMMYLEDGVELATKTSMTEGKGFFGKLFEGAKRSLTGESFFITQFTNQAPQRRDAAFAAPYPGRIIPVELGELGGSIICQKDSFLCCARGVEVNIHLQRKIGAGLFSGEGFILQRLSSPTGRGQAFVHAGGTIVRRDLKAGERLRVDTGCVVAFQPSINFDIQMVPGIRNKLFGGEGLFYTTLTGPGIVWLQTIPFSRLADRIITASNITGSGGQGEGSVLGGLGRMLDGD